jgi:cell division protein FtsW (lipid II flippase)
LSYSQSREEPVTTTRATSEPLRPFVRDSRATGVRIIVKASTPGTLAESWTLRRPERLFFGWSLFCVALGFLLAFGASRSVDRLVTAADLLPLGIYALSLVFVHGTLVLARFRGDQLLLGAVALLSGLGLLVQYRMGAFAAGGSDNPLPYLIYPAGMLLLLAVCLLGMRGRYNLLARFPWGWAALSLLLIGGLLATGQRFRGAVYGAGFITPTELLKLTVILFLAGYLVAQGRALASWHHLVVPPLRRLLPLLGFWLVLTGLLLLQRDLGMFVLLSVPMIVLLWLGTGRIGYLLYGLAGAVGAGWLVLGVFAHGQRRIAAWQDPFSDPTGGSWQILQGLTGMFSGGLWGEGFGQGNPEYTPIAASDFIYSVIGEELGFLGSALLVLFFLLLFQRGLQIASRTRSQFGWLSCTGLVAVLAVQTFLNIGGVTKLIPLTGITLPFISHGGSSLITAFASIGLMLAVSDGEPKPPSRGKKRVRRKPARR